MTSSKATVDRLLLLADHVRLSLLERQRAFSLGLEVHDSDAYIERSLDTIYTGLGQLERERLLPDKQDNLLTSVTDHVDKLEMLRESYHRLQIQFSGSTEDTHPVVNAYEPYQDAPSTTESPLQLAVSSPDKSVRFSETLVETQLFDNQQLMDFHEHIMDEQDTSLDRLGESISRQRELSIQIGDELDAHVELLNDVEGLVDRSRLRLNNAQKRLSRIGKKARDNWSTITIVALIIILILLIVVLK